MMELEWKLDKINWMVCLQRRMDVCKKINKHKLILLSVSYFVTKKRNSLSREEDQEEVNNWQESDEKNIW